MSNKVTLEKYLNIFLRNKPRNKAILFIGSYIDFDTFYHDNNYGVERTFKCNYNNHILITKLKFNSEGTRYFILYKMDKYQNMVEIVSVKLYNYDEDYNNKCIISFKQSFLRRMLGGS